MATAFFPQGMESYNNSLNAPFTAEYKTWKGKGLYSNPVGITAGNIRPLTNKDYGNIAVYKKGAARPLKWQFRKQTLTEVPQTIVNPLNPKQIITIPQNRGTKSAAGLENKSGGLIGQLMDRPGGYSVKQNRVDEIDESTNAALDCATCNGISLTTDYYPTPFLTNNPLPVCTNPQNCCNEPRKALRRVRPASTILKKNYFTTLQQYRENRCKTYEQRVFNFKTDDDAALNASILANNPNITPQMLKNAKPGSPLTLLNTYVGNCYPNTGLSGNTEIELVSTAFQLMNNAKVFNQTDINTYYSSQISSISQFVAFISNLKSGNSKQAAFIFSNFISNPYLGMSLSGPSNPNGCKLVVYKPSNPQFAVQGSVSSSTRTLKLGVSTIATNVNNSNALKGSSTTLAVSSQKPFVPFIYKAKTQKCNPALPIIFRQVSYNPKICFRNSNGAMLSSVHFNGNLSAGPNVANNGISASIPGGQPIR